MSESNIEIYKSDTGETEISVRLENETVWLSLAQFVELFQRDKSVISRHLNNVFKEGELSKEATVAKIATVQTEGGREVERNIEYFNLDVIISVGYRIKSQRGTQFRIWANKILKDYLIKGFSLNEKKLSQQNQQLKQLQESVKILGNLISNTDLSTNESIGLLKIISDYAYALDILDQYDYQTLEIRNTSGREIYQLTYDEAISQIRIAKNTHGNSDLFGREKDESFRSSIASIYQTAGGVDVYPSIEEKAANLLYFITKNHSFTDGNKRIAAFLFLYFMERNGELFDGVGNKRIADNTLVALTLMVAVSKPEEKDTMIKVIVNLINRNN
ncbi:MAG: virulence protein RhuM/Fic/DOC family protein [Bacteroidales bacterium]|nr:virulence protein RhuM/Fic/DOC family protein [Bacteroidales bacterium]